MRIRTMIPALTLTLFCALQASAQTPGAANGPNPGVTPVRQIDRAEVRVTRVELQAGAVRSVHTHDDVRFHLFIPVTGKLELTIGSALLKRRQGKFISWKRGRRTGSGTPDLRRPW